MHAILNDTPPAYPQHPFNNSYFLGGSVVKNLPANAQDISSVPESGRSPGEGHDNPLQYSCLEKPGRLQSIGSQSVWQDWSDLAHIERLFQKPKL